jgi:hypothetical protein
MKITQITERELSTIAHGLDRLLHGDIPTPQEGICGNLANIIEEEAMTLQVDTFLTHCFRAWGLYHYYPVNDPTSDMTARQQYNSLPKWEGRQLHLRITLLEKLLVAAKYLIKTKRIGAQHPELQIRVDNIGRHSEKIEHVLHLTQLAMKARKLPSPNAGICGNAVDFLHDNMMGSDETLHSLAFFLETAFRSQDLCPAFPVTTVANTDGALLYYHSIEDGTLWEGEQLAERKYLLRTLLLLIKLERKWTD